MKESSEFVSEESDGLQVKLFIQPNASKSEIIGVHDGRLKVKICSPPVDNAANKECIKFLSRFFRLSKSGVKMIKGEKSRQKLFQLSGISREELFEKLDL